MHGDNRKQHQSKDEKRIMSGKYMHSEMSACKRQEQGRTAIMHNSMIASDDP